MSRFIFEDIEFENEEDLGDYRRFHNHIFNHSPIAIPFFCNIRFFMKAFYHIIRETNNDVCFLVKPSGTSESLVKPITKIYGRAYDIIQQHHGYIRWDPFDFKSDGTIDYQTFKFTNRITNVIIVDYDYNRFKQEHVNVLLSIFYAAPQNLSWIRIL